MSLAVRSSLHVLALAAGAVALLLGVLPAPAAGGEALQDESVLFQDLASAFEVAKSEEQVAAASKHTETPATAPATVTVVTAEEIEAYGHRTLGEVLASVPGLFTSYDRNYTQIGVRGFARPGDFNSRVLLLVDGRRLNDAVYDGALAGTEFPIDIDLIEQVEVIRGPGSALYGANAVFAVVNVRTRNARQVSGVEAAVSWSSYDSLSGRVTYGNRSRQGVDTLVSLSGYGSGGQNLYFREYDAAGSPVTIAWPPQPGSGGDGMARGADADRSQSLLAKASWRDLSFELFHGSREKHVPTAAYGTLFGDSRYRTSDTQSTAQLSWDGSLAPGWGLAAALFYDLYEYDGWYPYDWSEAGDGSDVVINRDWAKGERWGSELKADRIFSARHRLSVGAELRDSLKRDQGNYDLEVYLDDRRSATEWGLFAQDELKLGRRSTLIAGARWDHYSAEDTLNPRLALLVELRPGSHLKLMAGRAFRPANTYELHYSDGYAQKPALRLDPETMHSYEVSYGQELRPGLEGSVALYRYRIENLISLSTDPDDLMLVFVNAGSITAEGVELGIDGRLLGPLRGRVSYAWQRSSAAGESALTNSPEHLAKLNLWAPLAGGRLRLAAEVQSTSELRTLSGSPAGSAVVTNLNLLAPRLPYGLRLSAGVYNLFDVSHAQPASEEHLQGAIRQDGRSFRLKLSIGLRGAGGSGGSRP